jgi:glycosyltransferase involved in cell wall biosynthesis
MDISIVIPFLDEAESLPELIESIQQVANQNHLSYEVIMVDDGSSDNSWQVVEQLRKKNSNIKGIKFQRNYGKSAALNEGFRAAQGDVVITMDGDLQDNPCEIPELRRMILEDNYDLVSGWKKTRHDPLSKTLPSRFFNWFTTKVSKIKLHDFNCGLKAYKLKVVKSIEVYGEMHRYIPLLAKWSGFKRIGEKQVEHRARKYGKSKFGMRRLITGGLDLASIVFVGKYSKRPMHFFGLWGTIFFLTGFGISIYLITSKIIDRDFALTNRPGFFLALATTIIGVQLFLAGFLGELISRNSSGRNSYLIEEKIGF